MIVYAVNIHTGGGKVLLDALIVDQPFGSITKVYADARYKAPASLPKQVQIISIKPTLLCRLRAELQLLKDPALNSSQEVLFFGNLPPLFKSFFSRQDNVKFILYLQNAFLIMGFKYPKNSFKELIRITIEKIWLHLFSSNVDEIWVQTPWMRDQTKLALSWNKTIKVAPFLPKFPTHNGTHDRVYKFLYVGSLAKHKGIDIFLEALKNLDPKLNKTITVCIVLDSVCSSTNVLSKLKLKNIKIDFFTSTNRDDLFKIYEKTENLICTSRLESFYLPIYEAHSFGCTVVLPSNATYSQNLPAEIKTKTYVTPNLDLNLI